MEGDKDYVGAVGKRIARNINMPTAGGPSLGAGGII